MQDAPGQVEFDAGLDPLDRLQLAFEVGIAQLGGADVGGHLDHLERQAVGAGDRVVRRLQPHGGARFGEAHVLAAVGMAAFQTRPQFAVGGGGSEFGAAELAVVHAFQLVETVAHGAHEVVVGVQHIAVEIELDQALALINRMQNGFGHAGGRLHARRGSTGVIIHVVPVSIIRWSGSSRAPEAACVWAVAWD